MYYSKGFNDEFRGLGTGTKNCVDFLIYLRNEILTEESPVLKLEKS